MAYRRLALLPLVALLACGGSKKPAEDASSATSTSSATTTASHDGPAEIGKPAPDLSIQSLNAQGDLQLAQMSGKVVVVDFWATWCGPCRKSFPALEAIAKRHPEVAIVGVSVNDENDGIADFAKELGTTFPIGWDKGHAIADRWKPEAMPSSYIVDTSGTVRFMHAGFRDGEAAEIEKEVASLLGKAAPAAPDTKPNPAPPAVTQDMALAVATTDTASTDAPKSTGKKPRKTNKKKKPKKAPLPQKIDPE